MLSVEGTAPSVATNSALKATNWLRIASDNKHPENFPEKIRLRNRIGGAVKLEQMGTGGGGTPPRGGSKSDAARYCLTNSAHCDRDFEGLI